MTDHFFGKYSPPLWDYRESTIDKMTKEELLDRRKVLMEQINKINMKIHDL